MRKIALLLVLCIIISLFSACTFSIPSIPEAKKVVDAYVYYNRTGKLPPNLDEIIGITGGFAETNLQEIINETPEEILKETLKEAESFNILSLAEQYYNFAYPGIEADTREEYSRLVTWKPDFSGKTSVNDANNLQKQNSINVVLALSHTNAKNFYLAMAAAVLSLNPGNITALGNFAAALAAYADDSLAENPAGINVSQYYEDTEKVYHYALLLANGEDHKNESLPILVSLGNMYLDNNRIKEAYACFQAAREISSEYFPAVEGLYNTYMALKEHKKALELITEHNKYPVFVTGYRKVAEKNEEDNKKPGVSESNSDEEALKRACDSYSTIESVSVADYLGEFDEEAQRKLDNLIKQVQGKMVYKAPDITIVSQFSSVRAITQPLGSSCLEAFYYGLDNFRKICEELAEKVVKEDISEEALMRTSSLAIQANKTKDYDTYKAFFEAYSAIFPEFSIYILNPFEYANPVDIVVQRLNVAMFTRKHANYAGYLGVVYGKTAGDVDEIVRDCWNKVDELWDQMVEAEKNLPDDATQAQRHAIHMQYIPRINDIYSRSWNEATQIASKNYLEKIKPYVEKMYNDCMKHIILISDDVIRQKLEEKLQFTLFNSLLAALDQVYTAYSFVGGLAECGCDTEAIAEEQQRLQKEAERLANEQIMRNMEAKKAFEKGEIDENSEYYQKIIKPYEVRIDTPFVQGVVGPYKSGFTAKIDLPFDIGPALSFGMMENHIRNTTTYNGGIEISKGPVKAYLKFSATQDSSGRFSADDVDISGGGEVSFKSGCAKLTTGMEASALRGTKTYTNYELAGDELLNSEMKKYLTLWNSKIKKNIWNGEYPIH